MPLSLCLSQTQEPKGIAMKSKISPCQSLEDFNSSFSHLNTLLLLPQSSHTSTDSSTLAFSIPNISPNTLKTPPSHPLSTNRHQNPPKPQKWLKLPFPNHPSPQNPSFFCSTETDQNQHHSDQFTCQEFSKSNLSHQLSLKFHSQELINGLYAPNDSKNCSFFRSAFLSIETDQNQQISNDLRDQELSKSDLSHQSGLKFHFHELMNDQSVLNSQKNGSSFFSASLSTETDRNQQISNELRALELSKSNLSYQSGHKFHSKELLEDHSVLNSHRNGSFFCSASLSVEADQNQQNSEVLRAQKVSKSNLSPKLNFKALMKSLSVLERSVIGALAGGMAGAFTYFCLLPLDAIKTKLQTKGASEIYSSALDAAVKTFQTQGILGFYSGASAVVVGSAASSAVYFGTCEFGKSILSKLPHFPAVLIPPTAGAMGNIVSSAVMVPKELITQRIQSGAATGRSWQVLLSILEKDGVLGLYAGYSATLLRNLPAGVLSYSSFEYLKAAVLTRSEKGHLEPLESVFCGALAGAISASLTTPLDVVKTRLMTQVPGAAREKIAASVYGGVAATVRQIMKEEGWVGLTRGMGPRVLHSACFAALGYFAFETARIMLLQQYVSSCKEELEPAGVRWRGFSGGSCHVDDKFD